jgi:polyphosphate kinase
VERRSEEQHGREKAAHCLSPLKLASGCQPAKLALVKFVSAFNNGDTSQMKDVDAARDPAQALEALQVDLVTTRIWSTEQRQKLLVIFEGRDAAGKDGTIKRLVQNLSVRNTRIVALPKPTDHEKSQWYFQRYIAHLPAAGDWVIFNRSWYNRGGVERVMGFSTEQEQEQFLHEAPHVEQMLVDSGLIVVKYWLDISKDEQAKRLEKRRSDPVKRLKVSPLDAVAQARWSDYSAARDEMLRRTDSDEAPWWCVRADSKKQARLAVARHLLRLLACPEVEGGVAPPDPDILFRFEPTALADGRLAP